LTLTRPLSALGLFRSTAARLTDGKTTDREKLEALTEWTNEMVRPQYAAPARCGGQLL
jgi:hypothetical protein